MREGGHLQQLDGLRGIAIGLVLLSHFPPSDALHAVLPWGHLGVQLFFVLSGFLITRILLDCRDGIRQGTHDLRSVLRGFYGRRLLRIFPLFYVALMVAWAADLGQTRSAILFHATYLSNVHMAFTGEDLGNTTHFWSLAVEEQFYLFWPLVLLAVPRRGLLATTIAAAALGPAFRLTTALLGCHPYVSAWLPFGNVDSLCGGAALAVLAHEPRWASRLPRIGGLCLGLGGAGLVVFAVANSLGTSSYLARLVVLRASMSVCCVGAVELTTRSQLRLLESRPLCWLGKVSYCVYVVHYLLPEALAQTLAAMSLPALPELPAPVTFLLFSGLSIGVAAMSYRWLEAPLLRLKRRFPYELTRASDRAVHTRRREPVAAPRSGSG